MKMLRNKKKWVSDYEESVSLYEDAEVIFEFFKDGEGTAEQVDNRYQKAFDAIDILEFKNMLSEKVTI